VLSDFRYPEGSSRLPEVRTHDNSPEHSRKDLRRGHEFWCHSQPNGNPIRGSHEKIKMTIFSDTIRITLTSCHPLNVKGPNYSANANEARYNEVTVQNWQLYAALRPPKPVAQHCKPFASISKPFSDKAQSTKLVG
jgi:hypothetical protein